MSFRNSISPQFVASVIAVLIAASSGLAQSGALKSDLDRAFTKYDLSRLDDTALLTEGRVKLRGRNGEIEIRLFPRDLRSKRYQAQDTGVYGVTTLERKPVHTYMGTVAGEIDSVVRLTVKNGVATGYFVSKGERYFVESAGNYSRNARETDLVIYTAGNHLDASGFFCQTEFEKDFGKGLKLVPSSRRSELEGPGVVELATEADFEYVTALGDANAANTEILDILNMVEGVYQPELNLSIQVVFQHTWSAADPFDGTTPNTLLNTYQSYWNTNFPTSQYPRDTSHLFSAKQSVLSSGFAYVGTVCSNPSAAYGLSGLITWAPGKYLITAHEIGHNLSANHVDATQGCGNTIMNAVLSGNTPMTFCPYSRNEIGGHVSSNGDCLAPPASSAFAKFDFDGDARSDVSVWRPANGVWYIAKSGDNGFNSFQFGQNGDRPIAADYDGDGMTDAAVFRAGFWYVLNSGDGTFSALPWGAATDLPAPADYDGDGKADSAVFRPENGVWYILRSSDGGISATMFGMQGDVPIPADYDGDGKADINVWRTGNGVWYRLNSGDGSFYAAAFGQSGDIPLSGDFDGDSRSDLAVFRPTTGTWFVYRSTNNSFFGAAFGMLNDVPTPGDFDGDGQTDIAVFRPSSGVWYRLNSGDGAVNAMAFGLPDDMPTPASYQP